MMCLSLSQLRSVWLREDLIESQKILNPTRFHKKSTREISIVEQHNGVNQFTGWAIIGAMKRFKKSDNLNNPECRQLLSLMLLRGREKEDDYVEKYYNIDMALLNNGGLTLVKEIFLSGGNK